MGVRLSPRECAVLDWPRGITPPARAGCLILTMDIRNSSLATTGIVHGENTHRCGNACGSPGSASSVWFPDLRRDESFIYMDIMVKF